MDDRRLDRIESKLDELTKVVTDLARIEERMVTLFKRMDKYDGQQANLVADGVTTGQPTFGAGSVTQDHALGAGGITAGQPVVQAATATIVDGSAGSVRYSRASGDTDTVGAYQAEFQVTYSDGKIESFPNDGYIAVEITDDIA